MSAPPARRLFFMHIMKTAGFSTSRQLANAFPNARIWGDTANDEVWFLRVYRYVNPRPLAHTATPDVSTYNLFFGHFPFVAHELMGSGIGVATVVRHPVDRVVSFLKHCQQNHTEHLNMTLEQIYEDAWYSPRFFDNHCVRLLAMTIDEMLAHPIVEGWGARRMMLLNRWRDREDFVTQEELAEVFTDLQPGAPARVMYESIGAPNTSIVDVDGERVRQAVDNLEGVDVLGLYEAYPDFIDELSTRLDVQLRSDVAFNVSAGADVRPSLKRRIAHDNAADMELYEAACRLVDRRRRHARLA